MLGDGGDELGGAEDLKIPAAALTSGGGRLGFVDNHAADRVLGDLADRKRVADDVLGQGLPAGLVVAGQPAPVMSSFMEGLPVVLMEALAMQVPVIAPCVAGIPELVRHGETGLLFNAGDWQDLADKIEYAAINPDHCKAMAAKGCQLVVELFDINRATEPKAQRFLSDDPGNWTVL